MRSGRRGRAGTTRAPPSAATSASASSTGNPPPSSCTPRGPASSKSVRLAKPASAAEARRPSVHAAANGVSCRGSSVNGARPGPRSAARARVHARAQRGGRDPERDAAGEAAQRVGDAPQAAEVLDHRRVVERVRPAAGTRRRAGRALAGVGRRRLSSAKFTSEPPPKSAPGDTAASASRASGDVAVRRHVVGAVHEPARHARPQRRRARRSARERVLRVVAAGRPRARAGRRAARRSAAARSRLRGPVRRRRAADRPAGARAAAAAAARARPGRAATCPAPPSPIAGGAQPLDRRRRVTTTGSVLLRFLGRAPGTVAAACSTGSLGDAEERRRPPTARGASPASTSDRERQVQRRAVGLEGGVAPVALVLGLERLALHPHLGLDAGRHLVQDRADVAEAAGAGRRARGKRSRRGRRPPSRRCRAGRRTASAGWSTQRPMRLRRKLDPAAPCTRRRCARRSALRCGPPSRSARARARGARGSGSGRRRARPRSRGPRARAGPWPSPRRAARSRCRAGPRARRGGSSAARRGRTRAAAAPRAAEPRAPGASRWTGSSALGRAVASASVDQPRAKRIRSAGPLSTAHAAGNREAAFRRMLCWRASVQSFRTRPSDLPDERPAGLILSPQDGGIDA